jgi:hypothetical protein
MPSTTPTPTVSIRAATSDDARTLVRLAALDSAPVPFGPTLLAEIDGEPRAAIALRDGAVVADPFHRTAELVELLRMQAENIAGERAERTRPAHGGFARRLGLAA